ncbi:bifunctional metallophosphatase/5'-nucleotidase [Rubrobacter tropicus]|uniref:Bifunctional metallophosphatase/5'-nucleotidase n=1 Tax=Rubrobacter tropicus TaxID=2653851 RepID=A0A6G8QCS9_9ACTN|nr:5'-nucleotidase C-terminal domain-containing protein [Rubrobacter tropicus]QIN84305.1 bifunctional metallophosphatase/5'-nucleotidase [Rubrobacter tropicus]
MRRGRRAAAVTALVLLVSLTPLLISLTAEESRLEDRKSDAVPARGEPRPRGTAEIRLLGVNDFHGYLERSAESAGAAYLAAQLDRHERGSTIRVHAGDMVSASPLVSARFHDEPTVLAMNEMGFDVGTLGNHEFDEGKEEMLRLIDGGQRAGSEDTSDARFPGAGFPYVAANTLDRETGRPVLPPFTVVRRAGVKVGFIGVTTLETPEIVIPAAADDFRFADISETVNRHAAELEARGVRAIVVLAHSGALDTDRGGTADEIVTETRQMSGSVDAVFSGHTHNRLNLEVEDRPIIQAEEYGNAFGILDLEVARANGEVTSSKARVVTTKDDGAGPDPEVAALVKRYSRRVAPLSDRVVGRASEAVTPTPTAAGESPLGDFVADGQRDLAGTDFALVPTGGLRTGIAAGPVTYGELFSVQPSGRDLVKMELTGEQVRRALEEQYRQDGRDHRLAVSGLRYEYDPSGPLGGRVTALTFPDGDPLQAGGRYSVAVNGFLAAGGGDFEVFTEGESRRTVGTDIGALARHAGELAQPFVAPDPRRPRVRLEP